MNIQFSYHLFFNSQSIFKRIIYPLIVVIFCCFLNVNIIVAQQSKTKKTNSPDTVAIKINEPDTISRLSDTLFLTTSNTNKKNSNLNNDSLKIDSFSYLPRNSSAIKSIVKYTAKDSIAFVDSVRMLDLYGDAKVFYEDLNNSSEHITIDLNRNTISSLGKLDSIGNLIGTPEFKQGANDYKAVKITYNYVTKKGYLKEFKTKEGEGFVKGTNVKRDPENNFYIDGAYYTTCDAEHPHFYIGSSKIKVMSLMTRPGDSDVVAALLRTSFISWLSL
jgi:hypothetical protein